MTPNAWIALTGLAFTCLCAIVAAVVWMVRLEGRSTANEVAHAATAHALDRHVKAHAEFMAASSAAASKTDIEIVRLQEQIKHLTGLLERWLVPPATRRQRSPSEP